MDQLTKYEIARILSARANQIACGAPPLVRPTKDSTAYSITKEEFAKKVIPLCVIRVKNGERKIIRVD